MNRLLAALALTTAIAAPAAARPAPVEVTRFHTPQTLPRLKGAAVVVEAAEGADGASIEGGLWLQAVKRELAAAGFGSATPGAADAVAEVRIERDTQRREKARGPVSVGVGGSTGSYGGGVGLGVGINLGGGPKEYVLTRLSVRIRDRRTGEALWEGRAESREKAKAKEAAAAIAAPRMAHALFAGFPGTSGDTITVR
ncbi:hypothetical protein Saro_3277 [Novosphingobium aromaticivorans DSM 12444]|uniref:DUF4136 domain-containing protein n=1 Tax=Novosphingobium aromaticivorans (strain ATCC 700278 / DSM 12444 / CCUG 56034 / CIP 105152 / NBRC 16084 / F199) TaxID=279238 RepID=Q2G361_NOVAD|nr:DUF4136 domain-containing protein [Novosphingobium aromaticivorans]ABD27712.1 hypothetical protein Saro_3277 [Novosphingobium aromaticivorans DSM 12444]SCY29663.1 protein of unknown function [Novosphingobium aromaticivorans]